MRTTDAAVVLGAATGGQSRPGFLRVGADERYLILNADDFGLSQRKPGRHRSARKWHRHEREPHGALAGRSRGRRLRD